MSYLMVAFKIFAKFETEKVSSNLKRERENVFLARELTFWFRKILCPFYNVLPCRFGNN